MMKSPDRSTVAAAVDYLDVAIELRPNIARYYFIRYARIMDALSSLTHAAAGTPCVPWTSINGRFTITPLQLVTKHLQHCIIATVAFVCARLVL